MVLIKLRGFDVDVVIFFFQRMGSRIIIHLWVICLNFLFLNEKSKNYLKWIDYLEKSPLSLSDWNLHAHAICASEKQGIEWIEGEEVKRNLKQKSSVIIQLLPLLLLLLLFLFFARSITRSSRKSVSIQWLYAFCSLSFLLRLKMGFKKLLKK